MSQTDSLLRAVLVLLAVLVAIPLVMMLLMPLMGALGWTHMGAWMWNGTGTVGWGGMFVAMLLPLLIAIGGGYLLYRALRPASTAETDEALAELRRAYARGDLSDEEFETRRERLTRDSES